MKCCKWYSKILFFIVAYSCLTVSNIFSADGDLDTSFDGDGKKVVGFPAGEEDNGKGIALQADGKIIGVGATLSGGGGNWGIVRLNTDGSIDTTFGTLGFVTTNMGSSQDSANDVAVQTDQKIVVVGNGALGVGATFITARYNSNGLLDSGFGTSGITTTALTAANDFARAVALQSDGKIVVVGSAGSDFGVVRYGTSGALDPAFGTGGIVITSVSVGSDSAIDVVIQPDGKIVVAGIVHPLGTAAFGVVRYNTDGTLDGTFGTGGVAITHINALTDDITTGVGLQSDGKIIVFGTTETILGQDNFALLRYTANGILDTTFGTAGITTTNVGVDDLGGRIAIQQDDKIVAVGTSDTIPNFIVMRYTADGFLDTSFGGTGIVSTDISNNDAATDVAIQDDHKIVVIGSSSIGEGNTNFAFTRYLVESCIGSFQIGSDTTVEAFDEFQQVAPTGRIAKLAYIQNGFGLCGDATFDSGFPVIGKICLNGFTLTLEKDLITHNSSTISTMGDIVGNGHVLDLAKSFTCIPTLDCPVVV